MADDQQDTIAFLSDPSSYDGVDRVETVETHISLVFLAGDRAYKLKRAVKFAYLDFSSIDQRLRFCEAELRLNRRTAAQLYLETRPITRSVDGRLSWGDRGEIIDWVVVMRRFDQNQRLDVIAKARRLEAGFLYRLAAHIAAFHAVAEHRPKHGGASGLSAIVKENDQCLRASQAITFPGERIRELRDASRDRLRHISGLLDRRRAAGKVRRCHGDLHLRNICVVDGAPVLFDCIEFSEAFASIDVLYDLAFLLMDFEHQGNRANANLVMNRYLDLTGEDDGLAAMPLFLSVRAAIRAHVTASAGGAAEDAQAYLNEACAILQPPAARLIAIGGLSGSGKSTVAAALASGLGARPGARLLRSDVIRKRLFGAEPEARLPEDAYKPEVTARVYERLCAQAETALRSGYCVIIDAVSLRPEERHSFAAVAAKTGVTFTGIWLDAPAEALTARVTARRNDASDATAKIVTRQLGADPGPIDWHCIQAGTSLADTIAACRNVLGLH